MNNVYLSRDAHPLLLSHLNRTGHHCILMPESRQLPSGIASHPDLFLCKLGSHPDAPVYVGEPELPIMPYPRDVLYNAACTGKYFIHRLSITAAGLRAAADEMGMIPVDVRQGYAKCNLVVLDERHLITSDKGIHKTLLRHTDVKCLLIETGHVALPGFKTGFIGGASGRVGGQVIFHGALPKHPDFLRIRTFIESIGLLPVWFDEFPLTDIGSIIEAPVAEVTT